MDDKQELLSDIAYNTEDEISISDKEDSSFEDILDIPHVVEESIDIDEYLKRGGECGRFQILISALLMISFLPMVIPVMTFYYIGIDPNWKCSESILHNNNSFCANSTAGMIYEHTNTARCLLNRTDWTYAYSGRTSFVTEFDLVCGRAWLDALSGSIIFMGWGLGSILFGLFSDKFGRKRVMIPSYFMCLLCLMLQAFITSINQLLLVRFFMGFFFASPALNMTVLLLEIIGPSKRALAHGIVALHWTMGALLLTLMAYFIKDWRKFLLYCSAPSFVTVAMLTLLPESVRWLNVKGHNKEAENILRRAARINKRIISPLVTLKSADEGANNNKTKSASYLDLISNCKILKVVLAQGFLWFNTGMSFYTITWAFADLGGDKYLNFIMSTVVEVPSFFISIFVLQRFGRRKSTFTACILLSISCLGVACIPKSDQYKALRLCCGLMGKFMAITIFSCIYLWSNEIYATVVRTQGMGINIVTSRAGAATSPFIKVLDSLHPAAPFGLLTVTSIIASLCILMLPETLNKPTRETMADMLQDPQKHPVQMQAIFSAADDSVGIHDNDINNRFLVDNEDWNEETDHLID